MKVAIVEVGPRDGLQNEAIPWSVAQRVELISGLAESGLKRIEVGAFVSPKWVPQMQSSAEVCAAIANLSLIKKNRVRWSTLVPNRRGMEDALRCQVPEVAIFGACSETFSQKNINCSIAESFLRFQEVMALARPRKILVRGYLSTAFGCPYEGRVAPEKVVQLAAALLKLGVFEISIGDTIGVATPKQVRELIRKLKRRVPLKRVALHFHDTRGTALANVLASLEEGVRVFDSSVGGLGGCPYAQGASGNLATEDLVYILHGMGIETGVNLSRLIQMRQRLQDTVGRELPARVSRAGLPKTGTLGTKVAP